MQPEVLLPCSQNPATYPYPEPHDNSARLFNIHSNIIFKSVKWSHFFRLPHRNLYVFLPPPPYVPVFKNKAYTYKHTQVTQVVDISHLYLRATLFAQHTLMYKSH